MSLPPTRQLSEQLQISRNTVTLAYDRLVAEGYVESRGRAGTFVSSELPDDLLCPEGKLSNYIAARIVFHNKHIFKTCIG